VTVVCGVVRAGCVCVVCPCCFVRLTCIRPCPQAQFFTQKHKSIPFPPKKRYLWRSGWRSTVQGSRHTWTQKKNIISHIVSFPPLNYSPSVLAVFLVVVLVVVLLLCCCCCLCLLCCRVANTAAAATISTPPPPPLPPLLLVGVEVDVISLFGPSN
jgi:hypothetical protein